MYQWSYETCKRIVTKLSCVVLNCTRKLRNYLHTDCKHDNPAGSGFAKIIETIYWLSIWVKKQYITQSKQKITCILLSKSKTTHDISCNNLHNAFSWHLNNISMKKCTILKLASKHANASNCHLIFGFGWIFLLFVLITTEIKTDHFFQEKE